MNQKADPAKLIARAIGEVRYTPSMSCPVCGSSERWTCNGICVECGRQKKRDMYRAANADPVSRDARKATAHAMYLAHKPARNASTRLWHEKNRSEANKRRRERYHANIDAECASHKKWRAENVERKSALDAAWAKANPDKVAKNTKRWRTANKEKVRLYCVHRRARKAKAKGTYTLDDLKRIRADQNDCCAACKIDLSGAGELDHIVPIVTGGSNLPTNLQFLCRPCNRRKSHRPMEVFLAELLSPVVA